MITSTENLPLDTSYITTTGIDAEVSANYTLDRYFSDILTLPYSFEEIKIKSNELCVADNINASLYKLHHNFLYINSQAVIASNSFPNRYRGFIASTSKTTNANVGWHSERFPIGHPRNGISSNTYSLSHHLSGTNGTVLSGIVAGAFVRGMGSRSNYVGFVANSGALIAIEGNDVDTDARIIMNKKTIEDATALSFTNIKDVKANSENDLFVIDGSNVHKFDVKAVLTDNAAISAIGRFLIKSIGGKSVSIYEKDKFNTPISIAIGKSDKVYILDQVDFGFKVYDRDLNWMYTGGRQGDFGPTNSRGLSGGVVVDIAVDINTEHIYVLSNNGVMLVYDNQYRLVTRSNLDDPIKLGEQYKRLAFSNTEKDILYVLTNKSLFKKFKSRIGKSIGAFRLADNGVHGAEDFSFVSVLNTDIVDYDYVFAGSDIIFDNTVDSANHPGYTGVHSPVSKIFKFDEKINYKTIAHYNYKHDIFPLSGVNINTEEYVTSWVVNRALHKMLYNHLIFKDNIHMKFVGTYDSVGRLEFAGINYIKDSDTNLFQYKLHLNNFIGLNEMVLAETMNRPLHEIYKLQGQLLKMCEEIVTNIHPYPSQCVDLK